MLSRAFSYSNIENKFLINFDFDVSNVIQLDLIQLDLIQLDLM